MHRCRLVEARPRLVRHARLATGSRFAPRAFPFSTPLRQRELHLHSDAHDWGYITRIQVAVNSGYVFRMDFVCGGYFLTKPGSERGGRAPPARISLSKDYACFFPDDWALSWVQDSDEGRESHAAPLGIPPEELRSLIPRVTSV